MTFSLYDAVVPAWLQILPGVAGMIDKAEGHCRDQGIAAAELIEAQLAPDMWNFARQVSVVVAHSAGALDGARAGLFTPAFGDTPADFAGLRALINGALATVGAADAASVNALIGNETVFRFGERSMTFATEDFLTSFSLPNFYFHATAAYSILRMKGVGVGKMNFLGKVRIKPAA